MRNSFESVNGHHFANVIFCCLAIVDSHQKRNFRFDVIEFFLFSLFILGFDKIFEIFGIVIMRFLQFISFTKDIISEKLIVVSIDITKNIIEGGIKLKYFHIHHLSIQSFLFICLSQSVLYLDEFKIVSGSDYLVQLWHQLVRIEVLMRKIALVVVYLDVANLQMVGLFHLLDSFSL